MSRNVPGWISRVFGRGRALRPVVRNDGWGNVLTGLGTRLDKRVGGELMWRPMADLEVREHWLADDVTKRIIEVLPREMMRAGYKLKIADDSDDAVGELMTQAEELKFDTQFQMALNYRRAYGGAALFPVIDGAQGDLSTPLNKTGIKRVLAFHVFEPRELYPVDWYNDIGNPKFGMPMSYRLVPVLSGGMPAPQTMQVVHESRFITFMGTKVSRIYQAGDRYGWGGNVMTPIRDVVRDFGLTWGAVSALMQDFAQGVLKIAGLSELVIGDQDRVARDRLAQIDLLRSFMKMIVIDKNDDFERKQTPITGLADILDRMKGRLAFAADLPQALLFGESSSGLDSSSEGDREFMYDRVRGGQQEVQSQLEQGYQFLMLQNEGPCNGIEPKVWSAEWNPLWTPTAAEQANTRWLIAQADTAYFDRGTLTNEELRSHWQGDKFSDDITLDNDAWEAQQNLATELDPDAEAALAGEKTADAEQKPSDADDASKEAPAPLAEPADNGMRVAKLLPQKVAPPGGRVVPVIAHQRIVNPKPRPDTPGG